MTGTKPPGDIYEDSGFRLPLPKRDDLDDPTREIYDYFADPAGGAYVGLRGPGGIRLYSPRLLERVQALNRYLRREAGIDTRVRELAILVTARELDSQFEWTAHEPEALTAGVSRDNVDMVKYRRPVDGVDETDAVIIEFGRQMFGARKVTSETFARALRLFGPRKLVDVVSLMGNYAATAALLTAFDVQLHPGKAPLLPVP